MSMTQPVPIPTDPEIQRRSSTMKTTTMIVYRALATLVLACFAQSPTARADCQHGCYISNTFLGEDALISNTTGGFNTAVGFRALFSNTTGFYNTANGYAALYSNTTGDNNTATGLNALYSNTTGYVNTVTGVSALFH